MEFICCSVLGYLIGSINPSYLLAMKQGFDIRNEGSGNAGASNVVIMMGKSKGAVCALLDILKACFSIRLVRLLFPDYIYSFALTATACILGHIFPFYMNFRGGKGLACLGGVVLMYDARLFAILLLIEFIIAFVTDYICFVPISASILFPVLYMILTGNAIGTMLLCISSAVILAKHRENLERIRLGTEARFSYLWNRDAEIKRIKDNRAAQGMLERKD